MFLRAACSVILLAAVVTCQVLQPEPYHGPDRFDDASQPSVIPESGLISPWSQDPNPSNASLLLPAGSLPRRSMQQAVAGNCRITVKNACPNMRYFLIAYKTTKAGKKGVFTEGWYNLATGKSAVVPTNIRTTENLAKREWYIRFGDGIKMRPQLVAKETAQCVDPQHPFQFFTSGTARAACRYDGTYKGKCSTCAALKGTAGHGFYVINRSLCTGSWTYTFSAGAGNCR